MRFGCGGKNPSHIRSSSTLFHVNPGSAVTQRLRTGEEFGRSTVKFGPRNSTCPFVHSVAGPNAITKFANGVPRRAVSPSGPGPGVTVVGLAAFTQRVGLCEDGNFVGVEGLDFDTPVVTVLIGVGLLLVGDDTATEP